MSRITSAIIATAVLLGLILFGVTQCQQREIARDAAKIANGQAGAAIESGHEATTILGNRMDADASSDATTRENTDAIRNADGANAPVTPAVRDAAITSLCRRVAYRDDPRCLRIARP